MQEMWAQSLDWEDPLEEGMATHSSSLAWRIPWTEERGGLSIHGVTKSRTQMTTRVHACAHTHTCRALFNKTAALAVLGPISPVPAGWARLPL